MAFALGLSLHMKILCKWANVGFISTLKARRDPSVSLTLSSLAVTERAGVGQEGGFGWKCHWPDWRGSVCRNRLTLSNGLPESKVSQGNVPAHLSRQKVRNPLPANLDILRFHSEVE